MQGVRVRVTSPARTVVDCFRYRNKIGLDVALEALRDAVRSRKAGQRDRPRGRGCRIRTVIGPTWRRCRHERRQDDRRGVDPAPAAQRARARGEDVSSSLQRYAVERFLYRLGRSAPPGAFRAEGRDAFAIWVRTAYRPTRDVDFTGYGSSDAEDVIAATSARSAARPDESTSSSSTPTRSRPSRSATAPIRRPSRQFRARARTARHPDAGRRRIRQRDRPAPRRDGIPDAPRIPRRGSWPIRPSAVVAEKLARDGDPRRAQQPLQGLLRPPRDGRRLPLRAAHARARRSRRPSSAGERDMPAELPAALARYCDATSRRRTVGAPT